MERGKQCQQFIPTCLSYLGEAELDLNYNYDGI